jgi:hypothetical protein
MSLTSWLPAALVVYLAAASTTLYAQTPAETKPAQSAPLQDATSPRDWPAGRSFPAPTEQERRIHTAFEQLFAAGFEELTIGEIAQRVEAKAGCTVIVRDWELSSGGIDPAAKLTGKAEGKALRKELRAFLRRHDLAAAVRDECLQITSIESAEVSFQTLRIYQVHDLVVAPNDPTAERPDFEQLIHRIRSFCAAESWRDNGGSIYEIRAVEAPGLLGLAIVQSEETHEQIEDLLAMLRSARLPELTERQQQIAPPPAAQPAASGSNTVAVGMGSFASAPVPPPRVPPPPPMARGKVVYSELDANLRVYDVLRRPAKFDFAETNLGDVAKRLSKDFGFPIELDLPALTADGKGPETIITFRWTGGSLRSGLNMMLEPHGLTPLIANGRLLITTRTAAEVETPTRIYQVHDLFARDLSLVGQKPDFGELKSLVLTMIAPEAWRDGTGEPGDIQGFEAGGTQVLVIAIMEAVHNEVEAFLELLRDAKEPLVYAAQRRRGLAPEKLPAAKVSRATFSPERRSYVNNELGLSLRVGERLQITEPTRKDDDFAEEFAVSWLDRGPVEDPKTPELMFFSEPLRPDAPRKPLDYFNYLEQQTVQGKNNWVGWGFGKVKAESINGVEYAVAEISHDGLCGIVSYLTIRKGHALSFWLRYGNRDDLPEMKKVLAAVKYQD